MKFVVCRLTLWSAMYHIWTHRNARIHQERVQSEETIVKMIRWEMKCKKESGSYYNTIQNRVNAVFGEFPVLFYNTSQ